MGHVHTLGHALAHGAIFAVVVRNAGEALQLSAETIAFADEHDMDLSVRNRTNGVTCAPRYRTSFSARLAEAGP
jgi:hypothetical protein